MGYEVCVESLTAFALFDLRGSEAGLADWCGGVLPGFAGAGRLVRRDGVEQCHIGPGRWLLRADLAGEGALTAALRPEDAPPEISIVRVSDTMQFFRLTGADAVQIMAVACPLDLHETVFAKDAVSYTEAFGLRALVLRCEGGFDLGVEQSFGDMVTEYLARTVG